MTTWILLALALTGVWLLSLLLMATLAKRLPEGLLRDVAEFLPYLEIARWTGVGRQTVWGKGEIAYETF